MEEGFGVPGNNHPNFFRFNLKPVGQFGRSRCSSSMEKLLDDFFCDGRFFSRCRGDFLRG